MTIGTREDIYKRLIGNLPVNWFGNVSKESTPTVWALLSALVDLYYFHYNSQYLYALAQTRIQTATGINLDLISKDYLGDNLPRFSHETDESYRKRILANVVQEKVTRRGMYNALLTLTGFPPVIFEGFSALDCLCLGDGSGDPLDNDIIVGGLSNIDDDGVQHTYGNAVLGNMTSYLFPYQFSIVVFLHANQGLAQFPGLSMGTGDCPVVPPNPYFGLNYNYYLGAPSMVNSIITETMIRKTINAVKMEGTHLRDLKIVYINF